MSFPVSQCHQVGGQTSVGIISVSLIAPKGGPFVN